MEGKNRCLNLYVYWPKKTFLEMRGLEPRTLCKHSSFINQMQSIRATAALHPQHLVTGLFYLKYKPRSHNPCKFSSIERLFPLMLRRCLRLTRQCRRYSTATEQKRIVFSGIQPTGIPHLGNYLGALKNWVELQSSVQPTISTIYYCIVDLHAITVPYERDVLRKERDEMWYVLYAVGMDMERCTVFEQSAVHTNICGCDVLGTRTYRTELDPRVISPYGIIKSDDSMEGIFPYYT